MADGAPYSILVPAAITVVGWFIVARQAEHREFRKEVRDRVTELREVCTDVQAAVTGYWIDATRPTAPAAAMKLKAEIKQLGRHVTALQHAGLVFRGPVLVGHIRQVATGGAFKSANRRKAKADAEIVGEVAGMLEDLLSEIDIAFYQQFRPLQRNPRWLAALPLAGTFLLSGDS